MAGMNTMPGGGSGRDREPIQNWYAYDVGRRQGAVVDPLARNRNSLFGHSNAGNQMQGIPPMNGGQPTPGQMTPWFRPGSGQPTPPNTNSSYQTTPGVQGPPRIQTDINYPRPGMQGPPPMQGAPGQMGNPTGYQPMSSGQFQGINVRANPYTQQSNYYGMAAFNPQMYGGGAGYGFGGQFQGMNPYASMQQLQQWRNPYVNNMLAGGYLQQPQQYSQYGRPQMPGMPTMPQMPQFNQWNPYYNAQMGAPAGPISGRDR